MKEEYNKFRFRNRDLIKKYGEKTVREVFTDVWFFVNEFSLDEFTYGDILFYVNFGMNERGKLIIGIEELAAPVIDFILEGSDMIETPYNLYDDIYKVVSGVLAEQISNSEKFAEPLAHRITEEFRTGDRSLTTDQVALKLKGFPEFRFLPLTLLEETMDSVYDYFIEKGSL